MNYSVLAGILKALSQCNGVLKEGHFILIYFLSLFGPTETLTNSPDKSPCLTLSAVQLVTGKPWSAGAWRTDTSEVPRQHSVCRTARISAPGKQSNYVPSILPARF